MSNLIGKALIKKHEGFRERAYRCPAGYLTIGYGRNLETSGITSKEADFLLENDIRECLGDCSNRPYWSDLDPNQQAALLSMRYNLGAGGYSSFVKMHAALVLHNYAGAAREIRESRYYKQVESRAEEIARMIEG